MRHAHIVVDEDVNLIKTWVERVKKMDDNGAAFFLGPLVQLASTREVSLHQKPTGLALSGPNLLPRVHIRPSCGESLISNGHEKYASLFKLKVFFL